MTQRWDKAIREAFERNKERGHGPTTFRQLAKALPGDDENERNALNRQRRRDRVTEKRSAEIAAALMVPRESLPPAAKRLTVEQLEEQLDARLGPLEATVGTNAKNLEQLGSAVQAQTAGLESLGNVLEQRLGEFESRVRALENG